MNNFEFKSMGIVTELMFHRVHGVVEEREDYVVIRTPSHPQYRFGNAVVFREAPVMGTMGKWKEIFEREFGESPGIKHYTFLWDMNPKGLGEISEFKADGFEVDTLIVLQAQELVPPPKLNQEIKIQPVQLQEAWDEVVENQLLSQATDEANRDLRIRRMARYKLMMDRGLGKWFGAYLDGKLVGDLGIFCDGSVGRFQAVNTHPDYRRQGVCGTLIFESANVAFELMGIQKLVITADEKYHATPIYESLGFTETAREYSACKVTSLNGSK